MGKGPIALRGGPRLVARGGRPPSRLTGGPLPLFTRPPWGEASWIRDRSAPGRMQTPALRVGQLAGALTWRTPLPRPA
jgi:hypothetical protein